MNEATQQLLDVCDRTTEALADVGRKSQTITRSAWAKAHSTARAADDYVHHSPWTLNGAAALVAVAVGYVVGRR